MLANRLGRLEGFEGILLAGQTSLARRLGLRSLASLASRLVARVRLRPIDADEARTLLNARFVDRSWDVDVVERLHRDAWGNPGRLVALADRLAPKGPRPSRKAETIATSAQNSQRSRPRRSSGRASRRFGLRTA